MSVSTGIVVRERRKSVCVCLICWAFLVAKPSRRLMPDSDNTWNIYLLDSSEEPFIWGVGHYPCLFLSSELMGIFSTNLSIFTQIAPFCAICPLNLLQRSKVVLSEYTGNSGSLQSGLFCFWFFREMWKLCLVSTSESRYQHFYVSAKILHICVRKALKHREHRKTMSQELLYKLFNNQVVCCRIIL